MWWTGATKDGNCLNAAKSSISGAHGFLMKSPASVREWSGSGGGGGGGTRFLFSRPNLFARPLLHPSNVGRIRTRFITIGPPPPPPPPPPARPPPPPPAPPLFPFQRDAVVFAFDSGRN